MERLGKKGDENSRKVGAEIADHIKDDGFWDDIKSVLTILAPLYRVLKIADGEGASMGEIYEKMDNMLGEIKDIAATSKYSGDVEAMEYLITQRWEKMNVPLHCLGYALNPRFYNTKYLMLPALEGVKRKAPNTDKEVISGVIKSFEKFSTNSGEAAKLREQYGQFHMKKELFGKPEVQDDVFLIDGITW